MRQMLVVKPHQAQQELLQFAGRDERRVEFDCAPPADDDTPHQPLPLPVVGGVPDGPMVDAADRRAQVADVRAAHGGNGQERPGPDPDIEEPVHVFR